MFWTTFCIYYAANALTSIKKNGAKSMSISANSQKFVDSFQDEEMFMKDRAFCDQVESEIESIDTYANRTEYLGYSQPEEHRSVKMVIITLALFFMFGVMISLQ